MALNALVCALLLVSILEVSQALFNPAGSAMHSMMQLPLGSTCGMPGRLKCYGPTYNARTGRFCCDSTSYQCNRAAEWGCCGSSLMPKNSVSMCCHGEHRMKMAHQTNAICCDTKIIDQNIQMCCNGDAVLKPKGNVPAACCDKRAYNPQHAACCNGEIVRNAEIVHNLACAGVGVFSPKAQALTPVQGYNANAAPAIPSQAPPQNPQLPAVNAPPPPSVPQSPPAAATTTTNNNNNIPGPPSGQNASGQQWDSMEMLIRALQKMWPKLPMQNQG
ncbi:hypothetical protein ACOMHN_027937 [Nucella lapillus]